MARICQAVEQVEHQQWFRLRPVQGTFVCPTFHALLVKD